jgi:hypothetical protein
MRDAGLSFGAFSRKPALFCTGFLWTGIAYYASPPPFHELPLVLGIFINSTFSYTAGKE